MATITMYNSINVDDAYSPVFIAVPTGTAVATYATDPTATWTDRTLPSSSSWNSVCYGREPDILVAVAATTVAASSSDGITWTSRTLPVNKTWSSVAYGNGRFVAVADGAVETLYSLDGITWTQGGNLPSTANWSCVVYGVVSGTPTWVAIAKTTAASAWSTDDGATWSNTGTVLSSGDWRSVTFGNGKFVAVAYNSSKAATSTDGKNWTDQTMYSSDNWRSVCYGEGLYVAVAYNSAKAATSPNGVDWTDRVLPSTANWNAICYGYSSVQNFGIFMTVAYGATTGSYSYDGISWAARTTSEAANFTSIAFANFNWNSGDTLDIRNNATVTVNTHQSKFWKAVTGTYGKIRIENIDSTSINEAIGFYMGRATAGTANPITPASGLFSIEIEGDWIYLDSGDSTAFQTFILPSQYTEYIPCIEVETGFGTGVYEVWNNITGAYGPYMKIFGKDGLEFAGNGNRGNYFEQIPSTTPIAIVTLTSGVTTAYSRRVSCASTTGVLPGATISGTNIPAASVVNRVISSTVLELNTIPTTSGSSITFTLYNPVQSQFTNVIKVGDGIHGNVVPAGARVRVANIIFSDKTAANLMTASNLVEGNITIATASPISAIICMFGSSYLSVAQGASVYFRHVGFNYKFAMSECYNIDIDYMGTAATPTYWYYTTKWIIRDQRYALYVPGGYTVTTGSNQTVLSYITNAKIKNWHEVVYSSGFFTGTTPLNQIDVSYSDDMEWENIRIVQLNLMRANYGLYLSARCYRNTFTNFQVYGANPVYMLTSDDNTFTNVEYCLSMEKVARSFATLSRLYGDPTNNWDDLVDDTKYYIKTRTFWSWMDRTSATYYDSNEYSATAFQGGWQFPDFVSIRPTETLARSVTLDWVRRDPSPSTVTYEVYRSTSEGFTERSPATRVFASPTAATVTCAQGQKVHSINSAVRTWTFDSAGKTITAGGGTPGSFITDGFEVGDTIYINGSRNGNDGTYTITVLTATVMTVAESLVNEATTTAPSPYIAICRTTSKSGPDRAFTIAAAKTITIPAGQAWTTADGFAVGDVVDITGSRTFNNGTYTINTLTATVMTLNEPMVAEVTPTSTSNTTVRIFTFATSGDTITATGSVPGSFITDGHFIGDTIYTTSTTNPGPYTITNLTATVITVAENLTDETAASGTVIYRRMTITLRAPAPGTRYYYRFRKYNFNSIAALGCSTPGLFFTTNRAVTGGNTATITTAVAHGFVVGQYVTVVGLGDASYNGTFAITAVGSTTTFSYALTHGNESVADTLGRVSAQQLTTTYRAVSGNVATLTTSTPHLLVVNQNIEITGVGGTGYNGVFKVASVPSTTTFTYALTHDDETSTADTGGVIYNRTLFSAIKTTSRATATAPVSVSSGSKTMTFTASAKTIVLGSGSWVTDGFVALDTITITGSAAGNNGTYTISTVTASTLTVLETLPSDEVGDDSPVITVTGQYIVTLATPVAHGYVFGQQITVFGMNDSTYNGTYNVRALPSTTSLTYSTTRVSTETTTADNSGKITTVALDFDKVYYLGGFRYANGSTYVTNIVNNLFNSMFAPGVKITGQGIPADTTVVSVDPSGREMVISNATTMSTDTIFATTFSTTRRAVASNVATIVTSSAHGMYIGSKVKLTNMTDATYNGTYTITSVPSPTRFRFALTHADEGETPDTAGTVTVVDTILYIPAQTGMNIAGVACYPAGATVTSVESSSMLSVSLRSDPDIATQYTNAIFQTFNESAELTCVPNLYAKAMNYATYSIDFTNAAWTKSNITPTANSYQAPTDLTWGTNTLDQLAATAGNGTATLTVSGLKPSTAYTASFWVRADQTAAIPNGVAGSFAFGSTSTAFTATNDLKQYSATYTTGGAETSANIVVTITTNGQVIHAGGVMVNAGTTPECHIVTTSAQTELYPRATPLSTIASYCRPTEFNGTTTNQGIRIALGTVPSGSYYTEVHLSSTAGFTPSDETLVATTFSIANYHFSLSGSSRNTFTDFEKLSGGGAAGSGVIYLAVSSLDNKFINGDIDLEYTNVIATGAINLATGSHSNLFHNIDFGRIRNYEVGTSIVYTQWLNSITGNKIQNIKCRNYDITMSNQSLNSITKGIAGCRAVPANAATTYLLGSTSDGIAIAYTAAYGTMFYENYLSATEGVLTLIAEDTLGTTKPYTILAGTPTFTNTGNLFMPTAGDSVEITWPNKIYGVSGFRKLTPKLNGVDLGNVADQLNGLKIEYAINNGSGYGAYKRLTAANLAGETVSASSGFYIKFKLTTMIFMKFGAQTNLYTVGETIRGQASGATAYVEEVYDNGTGGTLILSAITGEFIPAENIVNNTTSQLRSPNVATNGFALGPSFTSYFNALQIFTSVNQNILYPVSTPTIRLTGLKPNSEIRVYDDNMVEIAGTESVGTDTEWEATYDYFSDVTGYIVIIALNYQVLRLDNLTFGINGLDIPVQQILDRQYRNP